MTRTRPNQNESAQKIVYTSIFLCLIDDKNKVLTKVQTKPGTGDRENMSKIDMTHREYDAWYKRYRKGKV